MGASLQPTVQKSEPGTLSAIALRLQNGQRFTRFVIRGRKVGREIRLFLTIGPLVHTFNHTPDFTGYGEYTGSDIP